MFAVTFTNNATSDPLMLQVQIRHSLRTRNQIRSLQNSPPWSRVRHARLFPPRLPLHRLLLLHAILVRHCGLGDGTGSLEGAAHCLLVWDWAGLDWVECSGQFVLSAHVVELIGARSSSPHNPPYTARRQPRRRIEKALHQRYFRLWRRPHWRLQMVLARATLDSPRLHQPLHQRSRFVLLRTRLQFQ